MKHKILDYMPELTRVSSKGQLVIPQDIRKNLDIREGDIFATTSSDHELIILKKIKNPITKEDLVILKEIEEAWKEIGRGKSKTLDKKEFLEEIKKW